MLEPPQSVPDLAEQLMHEFHAVVTVSTVTEVVIRLSRDGVESLLTLAEMARQELGMLAAGLSSLPEQVGEVP